MRVILPPDAADTEEIRGMYMATSAALVENREKNAAEIKMISRKVFSLLPTSLNSRQPSFSATPLSRRDSTMMNQHDVGAGKAGKGFVEIQDAGEDQGQHAQDCGDGDRKFFCQVQDTGAGDDD